MGAEHDLARVTMPSHVAVRRIADETVILNLSTGEYHGLDGTGSAFLEALQSRARVDGALEELLTRYDVSRERLDADLREFCAKLVARGLIVLEVDDGR
jgi:hypothetical protein